MQMQRKVLVLGLLLSIGCIPVSSHNGADLRKLDEFKITKGLTTERELVAEFGQPGHSLTQGDGSRVLTWTDSRMNGRTAVLPIPIPGATGQAQITNRSLNVTIRDGVVVDYMISGGSQESKV